MEGINSLPFFSAKETTPIVREMTPLRKETKLNKMIKATLNKEKQFNNVGEAMDFTKELDRLIEKGVVKNYSVNARSKNHLTQYKIYYTVLKNLKEA